MTSELYTIVWPEVPLVDLCRPRQWKTISTRDLTPVGYPVYGANGVIGKYSTYTHEHPTLMITCRGATCGNLHVSVPRSYINGNAMALDDLREDFCRMSFLKYALQHRGFDDVISGSAQPQITREGLSGVSIPLPKVHEQKRITDKLEAVLARVDACRERLDRVPAILKRFRQSVLAAATSGKLTEEWRETHGKQQLSESEQDEANSLYEIPAGWSWMPFTSVTTNFDGRRVPIKASDRAKRQGVYRYYGAFGVIDQIDDFLYDGEFLLLAEDGKNLESRDRPISLVTNGKFWVNNHAHVLQAKPMMRLQYLDKWLNSPLLDLTDFLTGIDQVKLTRGAMDKIPVPVPPIDEQDEIIRRIEALFAYANRIESRYTTARAQVERLTPALLAKAFRGELVPQDPNDESAAELIARISGKF